MYQRRYRSRCFSEWFPACDLTDKIDLFRPVRTAVRMEDVMKPDGELAVRVGLMPRIPWHMGLRFPNDQAPIVYRNLMPGDRQDVFECAPAAARHIFGAEDRAVVTPEAL